MTTVKGSRLVTMIQLTKKRLIIFAAVILVLVGGGIAFGVWLMHQNTPSSPTKTSNSSSSSRQEYTTNQKLVDEVNQKYGNGDYSGAIDLIEKEKSKDVGTQLLLAGAYANSGDLKKALEIYKALDAAKQLPDTALANMAETAERAGDYTTALDAYKRARNYAVSSKAETEDQVGVYDYKIAELEKKQ